MDKRIVIVDEQDKIVGHRTREELDMSDTDKIYRVSALWLTNSHGEILLAQRAFNKKHHPGGWGPAAAGTLEEGETYDSNMAKEVTEELGLHHLKLIKGPKRRASGKHNHFTQWYTARIDKPAEEFSIQKEEVEQVRWFTPDELTNELRDHPENYLDLAWVLKNL